MRAGNELALALRVSDLRFPAPRDDLKLLLFGELQVGSSFRSFRRVSVAVSRGLGGGLLAPTQIAMINRCHER